MKKNIPQQDYRQLLDVLIQSNESKSLAVLLIAYTGARSNEILKLTHKQIDTINTCAIHIIASKRGVNRWIPLPAHLLAPVKVLRDQLKDRNKALSSLVNSFSDSPTAAYLAISRYFNSLQVELFGEQRYTLHSWRHSLATRAFQKDNDIMAVKTMLGHKSMDATSRYLTEFASSKVLNNIQHLVEEKI